MKIHTHQNNPESISLHASKVGRDLQKDEYMVQHIYSVPQAKELIILLNRASFELSEWVQQKEEAQRSPK